MELKRSALLYDPLTCLQHCMHRVLWLQQRSLEEEVAPKAFA